MHKRQLALGTLLMLPMLLMGCASPTQEIANGTPTGSASAACISLKPISPSRGRPAEQGEITSSDIQALLGKDHPLDRIRNLVGDTASTLIQVDRLNASLAALCGDTHAVPH